MICGIEKQKIGLLVCGDILLIVIGIYLSFFIRFGYFVNMVVRYSGATIFIVGTYVVSFYIFNMYEDRYKPKGANFFARFLTAIVCAQVLTAVIFFLFPLWKIGRGIFFINTFFVVISIYLWRGSFRKMSGFIWKPKKTVIVGSGDRVRAVVSLMVESKDFTIVKITPCLRGDENGDACAMIEAENVDMIVVASERGAENEFDSILLEAKMRGVDIYDFTMLYEQVKGALPIDYLREEWIVYIPFLGMKSSVYIGHVKRLIDLVFSLVCMVVFLPVILLLSIMIRLDSKGPVLFKQKRVGKNGKIYELIKFRSMVDCNTDGIVRWTEERDCRTTRIGKFLRKTHLDELPQLWNVFKGEMSFVGPRPEQPKFVADLRKEIPFYSLRDVIRPGITGWAQVNYKYCASKSEAKIKLEYDLFYIKNVDFILDFQVALKTIRVMLFAEGSR